MARIDKNLFNQVLYCLDISHAAGKFIFRQRYYPVGKFFCLGKIVAAHSIGCLEDGKDDFFLAEGNQGTVAFDNLLQHCQHSLTKSEEKHNMLCRIMCRYAYIVFCFWTFVNNRE